MNAEDPFIALKPLHHPMDISWWPLAPGWWVLLALVAVAMMYWLRPNKPLSMHDSALLELRELTKVQKQLKSNELVGHSNQLLKRYALAFYPDSGVGALVGEPWLAFLQVHGPENMDADIAEQLVANAYRPHADELDRERLLAFTQHWLQAQKLLAAQRGQH